MSDLLIRNLAPRDKNALRARAARNGRSQQAEARAILENALRSESREWTSLLRSAAQAVDGIEVEQPQRHPARSLDTKDWQ
ncbi:MULTISPECIES: FitA-like ribbon-helix-helix domain-containing protein [Gordonibacter]|uniref:Antitoxin FitA-like ribbon-helix-helix domain-containing protein n=1 Tax=Gordonibacter faecis TaxID=3047475 RepID=A0ABT7DQ48_9ACTN|nr:MULTISPECIES: hypothetical protein [unclassified Gordonibacter]MDJ1651347.1 hypothetical protein [Gordonibacter sp. KGMB12511]